MTLGLDYRIQINVDVIHVLNHQVGDLITKCILEFMSFTQLRQLKAPQGLKECIWRGNEPLAGREQKWKKDKAKEVNPNKAAQLELFLRPSSAVFGTSSPVKLSACLRTVPPLWSLTKRSPVISLMTGDPSVPAAADISNARVRPQHKQITRVSTWTCTLPTLSEGALSWARLHVHMIVIDR